MLSKSNVLNAVELARQLHSSGKKYRSQDGTPLSELVEASTPAPTEKSAVGTTEPLQITATASSPFCMYCNAEHMSNEVEYITRGFEGETTHTLRMRAMADQIAPFVTSHLSMARNIVVPIIDETEKALNNFLAITKFPTAEEQYSITAAALPGLLYDEGFMAGGLENFNGDGTFSDWQSPAILKEPANLDELVNAILNLGSDRQNALVAEWLKGREPDFIKRVFVANFLKDRTGIVDGIYFYPGSSYGSAHVEINTALAVYLIATWLASNPQETVNGQSLQEFKNTMDETRIVSGNMVNRYRKRIDIQYEANVLVSEYNAQLKSVVVNAGLYKNWLEEGGCPEALLGYLVSNNGIMDYKLALENKDKGCRAWETYITIQNATNSDKLRDAFKSYVKSYMVASLAELSALEKEFSPQETAHRERVMKGVADDIEHFGHRIMADIGHLALHLVAKSRFYFTASYQILDEMREHAKSNPDIDPREAASLATLRYISEYVADQATLLKI